MGLIESIAPRYAFKREMARRSLARLKALPLTRSLEATGGGRRFYDLTTLSYDADTAVKNDLAKIRGQVRDLELNEGMVSGPIQRITENVVGVGFTFQSRVKGDPAGILGPKISTEQAKTFHQQTETLFWRWSKQADKRLLQPFNELLSTVSAALTRDNGVLVIGRESARKGRVIPYCLEVLEIDRLATPLSEFSNKTIRNGIRWDAEGVPVSYFVNRRHPGNGDFDFKYDDFEEIPAFYPGGQRKVFHLYSAIRPEQTVGFSKFAAALGALQDLKKYEEAEIWAAIEAACSVAVIKSENPEGYASGMAAETDASGRKIHEFAPGQTWHLLQGEDITFNDPKRPNTGMEAFGDHLMRKFANALNIPFEVMTQKWGNLNYSNARTVLLSFYRTCRIRQNYLKTAFCEPVVENVIPWGIRTGQIVAPGYFNRPDLYFDCVFHPQGWEWVDPVKESKGKQAALDSNFTTLAEICGDNGQDWEDNLTQRARELAKIKALEEEFGVTFDPKAVQDAVDLLAPGPEAEE